MHPELRYEQENLELIGNSTHPAAMRAKAVARDTARQRWIQCGTRPMSYVIALRIAEFYGERLAGKLVEISATRGNN